MRRAASLRSLLELTDAPPQMLITIVYMACLLLTLAVGVVVVIAHARAERARSRKTRRHRLRHVSGGQEVEAPLLGAGVDFHVFLSQYA